MKTTIKKALNITAAIILCGGLVQSLHRAANDYGLREAENVHPGVTAQLDDTSGNGGDTTSDIVFAQNKYMENEIKNIQVTANNQGIISYDKIYMEGCLPNETYTLHVKVYTCMEKERNICQKNLQGTYLMPEGSGGDTTSGGNA